MGIVQKSTILSELSVRATMRRQVISVPRETGLSTCINRLIKFKVNAVLVTDDAHAAVGVVSKTDIMGAYYAGLPIDLPVENIMIAPPLFCRMDDTLEAALEQMRRHGVYRLYVAADDGTTAGVIAYPDITGVLYQYCHGCTYSRLRRAGHDGVDPVVRYRVKDVMTTAVQSHGGDETLMQVMEGLSEFRLGAVLVTDSAGAPTGVVSKTDLVLAYKHGRDIQSPAHTIMSAPIRACAADEYLEAAIRRLIFSQIHRIFVYGDDPSRMTGVLSLSDAARVRSGSCQACVSSRIMLGPAS